MRDEILSSSDTDSQRVELPCFVKVRYKDGNEMSCRAGSGSAREFLLASSAASLSGVVIISKDSPLGKAVMGKDQGDNFTYKLDKSREFEGIIEEVG